MTTTPLRATPRLYDYRPSAKPTAEEVALRYSGSATPESRWVDIDGPVHYVDFGGPAGATTLVLVHGLMGSHVNWIALAPALTDDFRVIALDLVGHGLTERAGRRSDVRSNQRMLHRFLGEVVNEPAVLVGNSMGGLISIMQAADEPETVRGLVLVAPALPSSLSRIPGPAPAMAFLPLAVPVFSGALLSVRQRAVSAEGAVHSLFGMATADPDAVPADLLAEHIRLEEVRRKLPGSLSGYPAAGQSTATSVFRVRNYDEKIRSVRVPVLLVQGERDQVLSPAAARKAAAKNPHWDFQSLPHVGHAPMVEVPEALARSMKTWARQRLA